MTMDDTKKIFTHVLVLHMLGGLCLLPGLRRRRLGFLPLPPLLVQPLLLLCKVLDHAHGNNDYNGAWLLVRGLVKHPVKARPNQLSNSTLEFHQTTYQKPYAIRLKF